MAPASPVPVQMWRGGVLDEDAVVVQCQQRRKLCAVRIAQLRVQPLQHDRRVELARLQSKQISKQANKHDPT